MKILYLRTLYAFNLKAGGSVAHTAGVLNSLPKYVEVDVVSNDSLFGVTVPVDICTPVKIPFLTNGINELLYNFRIIKKLKKQIRQYDAIYQRHSGFSFSGAYLSTRYKIPFVLEFNSSEIWKVKNWDTIDSSIVKRILKRIYNYVIKLPIVTVIEKYNLAKASLIVVVSDVLKNDLVKRGVSSDRILVNPNGINVEQYPLGTNSSIIRRRLGLPDNVRIAGFIGTFGQWHGVLELAQSIIRFYEKYDCEDVRFLLIGQGILLPKAKEIIEKSPYKKYVIFTGTIPHSECPEYLSACDLFLSPHIRNKDGTEFFGSPTKLFEYMAACKPIIASNVGQIGKILEHGKSAYLVQPGNIEELADAIYTLLNDESLRKRLADNARKEVVEKYTWDKHVEHIINKLREIKENKGGKDR